MGGNWRGDNESMNSSWLYGLGNWWDKSMAEVETVTGDIPFFRCEQQDGQLSMTSLITTPEYPNVKSLHHFSLRVRYLGSCSCVTIFILSGRRDDHSATPTLLCRWYPYCHINFTILATCALIERGLLEQGDLAYTLSMYKSAACGMRVLRTHLPASSPINHSWHDGKEDKIE